MTTQGQKTPFRGKKNTIFCILFEGKLEFFGAGGPEKLVKRGFQLTTNMRFSVQHPQNRVGGAAGDNPGRENTISGQKNLFLHFFGEKLGARSHWTLRVAPSWSRHTHDD